MKKKKKAKTTKTIGDHYRGCIRIWPLAQAPGRFQTMAVPSTEMLALVPPDVSIKKSSLKGFRILQKIEDGFSVYSL